MAKIGLHLLHVLLILESSWCERPSEGFGEDARQGSGSAEQRNYARENAHGDMVSTTMFKIYDKYIKEPQHQKDANTVRSFKAVPAASSNTEWLQFNLSSIHKSENILSASLHFLHKHSRHQQRPWFCKPSGSPSCSLHNAQRPSSISPVLLFHGRSPSSASTTALGNVTLIPYKRGSWQTRDITAVVRKAKDVGELLVTVEINMGYMKSQQRNPLGQEPLSSANMPYVLVYADDRAIDEPNSVAASLQRYGPYPVGGDAQTLPSVSRARREIPSSPGGKIYNNDLPEVHFNSLKNHELWQNTYFPPKAKMAAKQSRKQGQESSERLSKPQILTFDERTMKKARRRQWSEPRVCARRYLKVDFADIGWSEWILAPKDFDAYYCSGTCGFPLPKVSRPSNHATIQSIVRAVGIVPGVPEPCCIPDKMSPLTALFLDPNRNMVLKVYPAMSVDTCACR